MLFEVAGDARRRLAPTVRSRSALVAPIHQGSAVVDPDHLESSVVVRGDLTLHGVSREVLDSIRATGTTKVRQTAFGIKPISVAGVVNVKDELEIAWTVVARASPRQ